MHDIRTSWSLRMLLPLVIATLSLHTLPTVARAAPAPNAAPVDRAPPGPQAVAPPTDVPAPELGGEAGVRQALAAGDLDTALARARALREANPTAAHHELEAEVLEARGDKAGALNAYRAALALVPESDAAARAEIEANIARLEPAPATPAPDAIEAGPVPAGTAAAPPATAAEPAPKRRGLSPEDRRLVTKWYFWVTVGAIVASAAAVTGIAIAAARDDRPDALDMERSKRAGGITVLRF